MGFLDDVFGSSSFPNYKDHILYNGVWLYKATGNFTGTTMEMNKVDGHGPVTIYFNVNVDEDKYQKFHSDYEIFRIIGHDDFSNHGLTMGSGRHLPTGRFFSNTQGRMWEVMREDDPYDVQYVNMPMFSDDNFNIGKSCI